MLPQGLHPCLFGLLQFLFSRALVDERWGHGIPAIQLERVSAVQLGHLSQGNEPEVEITLLLYC